MDVEYVSILTLDQRSHFSAILAILEIKSEKRPIWERTDQQQGRTKFVLPEIDRAVYHTQPRKKKEEGS